MTKLLSLLILTVALLRPAHAETVAVAAAADLTYCIEELNREFQSQNPGSAIQVSTGSSGNFATQIEQGAPFDLFLSADEQYPTRLTEKGRAVKESLYQYAVGRLVLWTKRKDLAVEQGLSVLEDQEKVKKLAIANPDHAPYGRAAKAALTSAKLWDKVAGRIVQGENISQTAQFVQTGNADAGLVALSLVLSPNLQGIGHYQEIDPALYPPLRQAAVLTTKGNGNATARAFLEFLRSETARKVFDRYGFTLGSKSGKNGQ